MQTILHHCILSCNLNKATGCEFKCCFRGKKTNINFLATAILQILFYNFLLFCEPCSQYRLFIFQEKLILYCLQMFYKTGIHKELIKTSVSKKEFCPSHLKMFSSSLSTFAAQKKQLKNVNSDPLTHLPPNTQTAATQEHQWLLKKIVINITFTFWQNRTLSKSSHNLQAIHNGLF